MVCVSFPKSCKCGPTRSRLATCQDLDEYESSNVVEFQDVEILNQVPEVYPKLSTFKDDYIDQIKLELNKFFPRAGDPSKARLETIMFNPLNQQNWPDKPKKMKTFVPGSIEKVANLFQIPYSPQLQTEFESLVRNIMMEALHSEEDQGEIDDSVVDYVANHPTVVQSPTKKIRLTQGQEPPEAIDDSVVEYISNHPTGAVSQEQENFFCNFKKSDPMKFWVSVLLKFEMSKELEKLIKSSIIIPMGSADAERSFSEMNLVKTKHKSRMQIELLDAEMRCNLNGPKLSWFIPKNYIHGYTVVDGHRKCDVEFQDKRHIQKLEKTPEIEEKDRLEAQRLGKSTWHLFPYHNI